MTTRKDKITLQPTLYFSNILKKKTGLDDRWQKSTQSKIYGDKEETVDYFIFYNSEL